VTFRCDEKLGRASAGDQHGELAKAAARSGISFNGSKSICAGQTSHTGNTKALLEAAIRSSDRVCLEGDNQKQADFLAETLADVSPSRIHDLHIIQTGIVLQAHLDLFDRGIAQFLVATPRSPIFVISRHFAKSGRCPLLYSVDWGQALSARASLRTGASRKGGWWSSSLHPPGVQPRTIG
jgi:hypothetical protein